MDVGVEVRDLPPFRVLAIVHKGSCDTLRLTYKKLYDYMMKRGMAFPGPSRELHLNDPCKTAPEELLTEIQVSIKESSEKA